MWIWRVNLDVHQDTDKASTLLSNGADVND
jgi:hypothetical protein